MTDLQDRICEESSEEESLAGRGCAIRGLARDPRGDLRAGIKAQLVEDVGDVGLYCPQAQEQRGGDLGVALALCHQRGHLRSRRVRGMNSVLLAGLGSVHVRCRRLRAARRGLPSRSGSSRASRIAASRSRVPCSIPRRVRPRTRPRLSRAQLGRVALILHPVQGPHPGPGYVEEILDDAEQPGRPLQRPPACASASPYRRAPCRAPVIARFPAQAQALVEAPCAYDVIQGQNDDPRRAYRRPIAAI